VSAGLRGGLALLLGVGTLTIFGPTLGFGFIHLDDPRAVANNPWIARGLTLETLRYAFTSVQVSNWQPLTSLSYALDVEIFGLEPAGFHATNLALHLTNSLLVFALLDRATGAPWPSAMVAALFAWHPLHVEPVAWVSERKELLAALFGLLAIAAYARWTRLGGGARYAGVGLCMALSLMAKPMWVTLPLLLLALDHWPLGRLLGAPARRVLEKLPLLGLSLVSSTITLVAQHAALATGSEVPLAGRVANALVTPARYLARAFWPTDLSVLYPHPYLPGGAPFAPWQLLGAALLWLGLAFAAWRLRRRAYLPAGLAWFAIALLPVIGLVQVGEQAMADRYTYVPLLGVFCMLAFASRDALAALRPRGPHLAPALAVLLTALIVACAVRAADQVGAWRDTVTLYRRSLEATPNSAALHFNLGNRLLARGEEPLALAHYESALRLRPAWPPPAVSLAWLLATSADPTLRDPARATKLAQRAVAAGDFGDANALDTLAAAQAANGDFESAVENARRAVDGARAAGRPAQAAEFEARRLRYRRGEAYIESRNPGEISNSSVR
jgi:tetratricopeptide (TPR) repeat protein